MSEREAWLYLAELWDKPLEDEEGDKYVLVDTRRCWGLCKCFDIMVIHGMASPMVGASMRVALYNAFPGRDSFDEFLWDMDDAGAVQRADFCRLMAKRCEDKS